MLRDTLSDMTWPYRSQSDCTQLCSRWCICFISGPDSVLLKCIYGLHCVTLLQSQYLDLILSQKSCSCLQVYHQCTTFIGCKIKSYNRYGSFLKVLNFYIIVHCPSRVSKNIKGIGEKRNRWCICLQHGFRTSMATL